MFKKKKMEEKDWSIMIQDGIIYQNLVFFPIKSISMYYFYKKKATILVLSNNYKKAKVLKANNLEFGT